MNKCISLVILKGTKTTAGLSIAVCMNFKKDMIFIWSSNNIVVYANRRVRVKK